MVQRDEGSSDEAVRRLLSCEYVVLDTETTGLVEPELVSVAVIDAQGRTLIDEVVRPGKPIEPGASEITGLTNEKVSQCPEFPSIEQDLSRMLAGRTVVIYNAAYDVQVLANTYARYRCTVPQFAPWCAMQWFAQVHGEWDSRRRSYRWQSLAKAATACGLRQSSPHTALADCRTTWQILQTISQRSGGAQFSNG